MGRTVLFLCVPCDFFVEHWTFESNNVVTLEIKILPCPQGLLFLLIWVTIIIIFLIF